MRDHPLPTDLPRIRTYIGVAYWLLVLFVFVGLRYADPGWAKGGIPLLLVGLPWSIVILPMIAVATQSNPALADILGSDAGNFLLFVVFCGGLNAILLIGVVRVLVWLQSSVRRSIAVAVTVVTLVGGVQLVMPIVDRNALELSRPRNVPEDAVHTGGSIGMWQHCTYDSARTMDQCQVWYRGGDVREEGEFVPYDGGAPATKDQLQIVGIGSGEEIHLRNGRILIPKAREAQMKQFLDGLSGMRQAP